MADEERTESEQAASPGVQDDVEDVIERVLAKGRGEAPEEEPPTREEQASKAAPKSEGEPKPDNKPEKAAAEEKGDEPEPLAPDAAIRAVKAGLNAGEIGKVAEALGMEEGELTDLLKVDKAAFASLRTQTRAKENALQQREQAIGQAEERIRSHLTSADSYLKAREAYEAGDYDQAVKLAFGIEGANEFYKTHREKLSGHDPRVTRLERELAERKRQDAEREDAERRAQQTKADQAAEQSFIAEKVRAPLLEVAHPGVAHSARGQAFNREVFAILDERHRRSPYPDEVSYSAALDEVAASVYSKNGWKELYESLTSSSGPGPRGSQAASRPERRSGNRAPANPIQETEVGPPEDETEDEKMSRWERRMKASLDDDIAAGSIGLS
jgi:hypothetical protein